MEVKVCPNCLSQKTAADFQGSIFGIYSDKCSACGFVGTMILMEKEDADKLDIEDFKSSPAPLQEEVVQTDPGFNYYCTECMRSIEGRKTLFGKIKCEHCGVSL